MKTFTYLCSLIEHFAPFAITRNIIPDYVVRAIALFNWAGYRLLGRWWLIPGTLALITTGTVDMAQIQFTFDDSRARRDLGYKNLYTLEQAVKKSVEVCMQYNNLNRT